MELYNTKYKKTKSGRLYFSLFRKHLADYNNLQIVSFYQIRSIPPLAIPWIERVIWLYNPKNKEYYEFDSISLERKLLKIKDKAPNSYIQAIKDYEKEHKKKIEYLEKHKEEIEKKENDEFIKFIKIAVGIIILFIIFGLMKWLITGKI